MQKPLAMGTEPIRMTGRRGSRKCEEQSVMGLERLQSKGGETQGMSFSLFPKTIRH